MLGTALPPCGPKVTQPEMSAALQRLENLGQASGHLHREVSDLGAFHSGLSWEASAMAALGRGGGSASAGGLGGSQKVLTPKRIGHHHGQPSPVKVQPYLLISLEAPSMIIVQLRVMSCHTDCKRWLEPPFRLPVSELVT